MMYIALSRQQQFDFIKVKSVYMQQFFVNLCISILCSIFVLIMFIFLFCSMFLFFKRLHSSRAVSVNILHDVNEELTIYGFPYKKKIDAIFFHANV